MSQQPPAIAPEALARFPPGTTAQVAAEYLRQAGGNLSAALEMCRTRSRGAAPAPATAAGRTVGSNNYFVGGGPSSGQAVVAPPAPPSAAASADSGSAGVDDSIESVFAKARENGARDSTREFNSGGGGTAAFAGVGRRLGHMEGPSPAMQPHRRLERTIRITFYENGFQIEDGPLRSFTDAAGATFLESINKGFIPRELVAEFGDVDLNVSLVDRREEAYVPPPPPAYVAFAGSGRTLAPPAATGGATVSSPQRNSQTGGDAEAETVVVDDAAETCKLAIMNLMGKRCEVTVNPTKHTVRDLRILASQLQGTPALPIQSFSLMVRDVPPRLLTDDAQTVDAAKCRNATIMMKRN